MRACLLLAVLLGGCADSLTSRPGTGAGGSCPGNVAACGGPACDRCPEAPENAGDMECVAHTCTFACDSGYLKCGGACCRATAVAAGGNTTCAILSDGSLSCWGSNSNGQLGPAAQGLSSRIPVQVTGLSGVTAVAVGTLHVCALTAQGVRCWGANGSAQLGQAAGADSPAAVAVPINDVVALAAGSRHTCAGTNSNILCWGANDLGQINGQPNSPPQTETPTAVPGIPSATLLASGSTHTCAASGNDVRCWGANGFGQLAGGHAYFGDPVTALAAGANHTCAIAKDPECWGAGTAGQLGDGNSSDSSTPVRSNNLSNPVGIGAGGAHSCGTITGGGLRCWGANASGQLGTGNMQPQADPVSVALSSVDALAAGTSHTCALLTSKELLCWGADDQGQTGTGRVENQLLAPATVSGR